MKDRPCHMKKTLDDDFVFDPSKIVQLTAQLVLG
jgi:hypothetical protein